MEEACKVCGPVTTTLPLLHLIEQQAAAEGHADSNVAIAWPLKLTGLVAATEAGCALCSFVLDRFFVHNRMWLDSKDPVKPWYRDAENQDRRQSAVNAAQSILESLDNDSFTFQIRPSHSQNRPAPDFDKLKIVILADKHHDAETTKRLFHISHATVEAYSVQEDPTAEILSTRPPSAYPASTESFENIKGWLHECATSHRHCSPMEGGSLPWRAIDVSDGENLRLEISQPKARYAALSYCWGGIQIGATTTANLSERIRGFPASELPQSIQDGIRITRELGLRYLWTDAQCILQDSDEDKGHEVSQMAKIYKNAHVTICAARAEKAEEGFLQDRRDEETKLSKDLFAIPYRIPNKNATDLKEAFDMEAEGYGKIWLREEAKYDVHREPSSRRAWTLQERLLAPRFLHYGSRLIWQCCQMQQCDGGILPGKNDLLGPAPILMDRSFSRQSSNVTLSSLVKLFQAWYDTVDDYSKRELTLPADKLPAIAGIAGEVSRISGVPYMAGLWKNNLLHDCMWTSTNKERFNRPKTWRAPSWSWASVDSPVSFSKITVDATEEAEVLDCEVELQYPDAPFGEIRSGKLRICGPLRTVPREKIIELLQKQGMAPAPPRSNDAAEWNAMLMAYFRTLPNSRGDDKTPDDANLPEEIHCMVTHSRGWKMQNFGERKVEEMCYFGLLLEKKENGYYERLGSFDNENREWLKDSTYVWARETVTIV